MFAVMAILSKGLWPADVASTRCVERRLMMWVSASSDVVGLDAQLDEDPVTFGGVVVFGHVAGRVAFAQLTELFHKSHLVGSFRVDRGFGVRTLFGPRLTALALGFLTLLAGSFLGPFGYALASLLGHVETDLCRRLK